MVLSFLDEVLSLVENQRFGAIALSFFITRALQLQASHPGSSYSQGNAVVGTANWNRQPYSSKLSDAVPKKSILQSISQLALWMSTPRPGGSESSTTLQAGRLLLGDLLGLLLIRKATRVFVKTLRQIKFMTWVDIRDAVGGRVMTVLKKLPVLGGMITSEYGKVEKDLENDLKKPLGDAETRERDRILMLPSSGLAKDEVLAKMREFQVKEFGWKKGFVSGAVYHGGDEMLDLQSEAYKMYSVSNPLHADLWPSVMKYEAEIVSMTANLLNGGDDRVCGAMTSGGTESILMATKTHRSFFERERGIKYPEIVAPQTAHAAIDKACNLLGIKLIHAPVDPVTRRANVDAIRARISSDTIMIYGSAPQFPHGAIDPIEELSDLAIEFGIGLHVDCCLGGFVLPFAKKLGYDIPKYNFELAGVTSMSVDTHKYAYSPKGTSVTLYRNKELRKHQYFSFPAWPGGLYVTPATAGSRPGALSAGTWASMMRMGEDGYLNAVDKIMKAAKRIEEAITKTEGLEVVGKPQVMVVAFTSTKCNIYTLNDRMHSRGWSLNALQAPPCVHMCVTLPVVKAVDQFISDLQECTTELINDPNSSAAAASGSAPIYGMASAMPGGEVQQILSTYVDVTLKA